MDKLRSNLNTKILRAFPRRTNATPNDDGVRIGMPGLFDECDEVWISVMDNGVGMDEEIRKHAFDPFFSTKEEVHGVGLGLAVSYGIIRRHGGRIEVTSERGKGSVFTVHLPLNPPGHSEGESEPSKPEKNR